MHRRLTQAEIAHVDQGELHPKIKLYFYMAGISESDDYERQSTNQLTVQL